MSLDVAIVDPSHVKVALENGTVRVLRVKLGPREIVPEHSHPDSIGVFLTRGRLQNTVPGEEPQEVRAAPGEAFWLPSTTHVSRNIGPDPLELLIIELAPPRRS